MADVFVSYSRRDSAFVGRMVESMSERGKQVWLDTEGIADGEVFPEAIKRAIEQSDAFVFVITPDAVRSAYCDNEVEFPQFRKRAQDQLESQSRLANTSSGQGITRERSRRSEPNTNDNSSLEETRQFYKQDTK